MFANSDVPSAGKFLFCLVLIPSVLLFQQSVCNAEPSPIVSDFIENNCIDCHGSTDPEGKFSLDSLQMNLSDTANYETWSMIYRRVAKGEMPPADSFTLENDEKTQLLSALGGALTQADQQRQQKYGRSELRRLSRTEYANSLKDVLDLPHLELEEMLPPDGLAYGYRKSAKALDFSHVMLARYLEVADYALWKALLPRPNSYQKEVVRAELKSVDGVRNTLQTLFVQLKQTSSMPLVGTKKDPTLDVYTGNFQKREPGYVIDPEPHFDGVATFMNNRSNHNIVMKPFKVKQSGYYKLRVHGWGLLNDHGKLLPSDRTETVAFYTPTGRLIGRCDVPPNVPTTSEVKVWLNEGEPIEYLAISAPNEKFQISNREGARYEKFKAYGIGLQWFEMEGPLVSQWPPKSHSRLLGDMKLEPTELQPNGLSYKVVSEDPMNDARSLIRKFASRVLRRPVEDKDILVPMRMVRPRINRGEPFVDALMAGYRAVLTSPEFLVLQEDAGNLDAWALSSRLSLFLWNSPPDDSLVSSAKSGKLLNENELHSQTERMLKHPKAARFVEHFLDDWLTLKDIRVTEPDSNLYPEYNGLLAESMIEETQTFFSELLNNNLPAKNIIDSDFLTINQRMARLYGIPGVHGSHTRKISVPEDSVRGGLLTQGSLLKITANGTTTSPVVRGTFVQTKLLGDPPPPPPAAVPAIEPDISGATTIREQLSKHRSVQLCASCHKKIDPPGFALEAFDVMGRYRDRYRATLSDGEQGVNQFFDGKRANFKYGLEVDSRGELPNGDQFANVIEFRKLLSAHEPQIARNLLEQLIVYSTGQPVGFADKAIVDQMMERLKQSNYGVRSMIHEVIQSELFRKK